MVQYSIAAHPAILHYDANTGSITRLCDEQLPIGMMRGTAYTSHALQVLARDVLLITTDGILEAEDKNENAFGIERLEGLLLQYYDAPLAEIAEHIYRTLSDSYQRVDDQSLLLVRFR